MKSRTIFTSLFLAIILFSIGSDVIAHGKVRSGGIGLRGTYWGNADHRANILINRYDYLSVNSEFGGGPYFLTDIRVRETFYDEEVNISTVLKPGVYAGGGLDFMLNSWFGLNFDVKYHVIDFDVSHEQTGFEYGLGIQFMWGRFRSHIR